MAESSDSSKIIEKVIEKAQTDHVYKAKLIADPHAALRELGIVVPAGVTVKVVENSAAVFHLVLPATEQEMTEESLAKVAAGLLVGSTDHLHRVRE